MARRRLGKTAQFRLASGKLKEWLKAALTRLFLLSGTGVVAGPMPWTVTDNETTAAQLFALSSEKQK
jgi:hypothetical protein